MRFSEPKRSVIAVVARFAVLLTISALASCGGSDSSGDDGGDSDGDDGDQSSSIPDGISEIVSTACEACGGDCQTLTATINDHTHTNDDVYYSVEPPVGGPHHSCWVPWTVYVSAPPTERWVHNLEHGGLVFLYNCVDGCADEQATLEAFVRGLPQGRALMSPYAEMDARFAVIAWGVSETTSCVDTTALQAFYDAHVDDAPESITADPPSSCPTP